MISLPKLLQFFRNTFAIALTVAFVAIQGFGMAPAHALSRGDNMTALRNGDRIAAIAECLPDELSDADLDRALGEMGNDQIERAFNLTEDPDLSEAEIEFKKCLKRNGIEPQTPVETQS